MKKRIEVLALLCLFVPMLAGQQTTGPLTVQGPLVVSSGNGDTNFNALQNIVLTTGETDWNVLKKDKTVKLQMGAYYPWFQLPFQNPGWLDLKVPITEFENIGGFVELGAYSVHILPDPQPGSCTLTHTGGTGSGATYYVYFADATGGLSQPTSCTDPSGFTFAQLGGGNVNILTYSQPGGYSNMLPARDGNPLLVVNDPGHGSSGVYSTLTACLNPSCTWTDDGSWGNIALSSLVGGFYRAGTNTTADMYIAGRPWLQAGINIAGGQTNEGGIVIGPLADPSAPVVTVNTTGSTTVHYYAVLKTNNGKTSAVSPVATVANSASTHDNFISLAQFTCWPTYDTWDLLEADTGHSLATNLPCSTVSNAGGTPQPYSFHDTGQSTSVYVPPSSNSTADITTTGNEVAAAIQATSLMSSPLIQATDSIAGHGYAEMASGDASNPGRVNFHMPGGASLPLTTDGSILLFNGSAVGGGLPSQGGHGGEFLGTNGTTASWSTPPGGGNVSGPGSSVTNNLSVFADTSGTLLADSGKALASVVTTTGSPASNQFGLMSGTNTLTGLAGTASYSVGYNSSNVPTAYLGPSYSPQLFGLASNDSTDDTSNWNAMASTISGAGGGWIDLSGTTNYTKLSSARITMPANVGIKGCGSATKLPVAGYIQPRCGLDLQWADPVVKLFFPNAGMNVLRDLNIIDNGSDTTTFVEDTNAMLLMDHVSFHGTKTCVAPASCPTLSNKAVVYGGSPIILTAAANASGGNTVYSGTVPGGTSDGLVGLSIQYTVAGFTTSANNGTFSVVHSSATSITLNNAAGLSETHAAQAAVHSFSATIPQGYFTGYGAHCDHCLFDKVSTAVELNTNANQVWIVNPTVTSSSGNLTGAPIVIDGYGNQAVGNFIISPLLEVTNYFYGIDLQGAGDNQMWGVECWDGTAIPTDSCIHLDSASVFNRGSLAFYNTGTVLPFRDAGASGISNSFEDGPGRTISWKTGDFVHIGSGGVPVNDIKFGSYTLAGGLPASANTIEAWISDSTDGKCNGAGGGSTRVKCFWNGSSWVPMGNGSSPTFGVPNIGAATGASLAVTGELAARDIASGTTNSDMAGKITASTGTATYSFTGTYANAPVCIVQDNTTITGVSTKTVTNTTITVTTTGPSDVIAYICVMKG